MKTEDGALKKSNWFILVMPIAICLLCPYLKG